MTACIVLAGGAARRMGGVDKAMLRIGDESLIDSVLAAAQPLCSRLVVVGPVRPTKAKGVVFTSEEKPGGGPVPAVMAGFAETGGAEEVFVLAVDLPLLSARGLEQLLGALRAHGADAAAAPDQKGRPNPLLAVYRPHALRAAAERLGSDHQGAPAYGLLPEATALVGIDASETLNVNTPADLAAAMSAHRQRRS